MTCSGPKTAPASEAYRDGWDAIDWQDDRPVECIGCASWESGKRCEGCDPYAEIPPIASDDVACGGVMLDAAAFARAIGETMLRGRWTREADE